MILVDTNLLVYGFVEDMEQHEQAKAWLDDQLSGHTKVGLPWESLLAFVRISTNHRIWPKPAAAGTAWGQVREWLSATVSWTPVPTEAHVEILGRLVPEIRRPNIIHDAHLAALAMVHGLELCSTDGDFARFQSAGLRWSNPLSPR